MFSGGQCGGGHRAQITSRAGDENLQDLFLSQPFSVDVVTDGSSHG
jgi:hypothetical protein